MTIPILQDLFHYNDWANTRILDLCESLSDEQLDAPRDIGFGSLRNTLFHVLEAERLWLERWQGKEWQALQTDAQGMSVSAIRDASSTVSAERNEMIAEETATEFERIVEFKDSLGNDYKLPVGHLMNHVSNHGIHHRAQALAFLKGFGKTVPAGLDFIFYKMANPSAELPLESIEAMRGFGLEVATGTGQSPTFERKRLEAYFNSCDWAMSRIFEEASNLPEDAWDKELGMGSGTLRKNLQHIILVECWWNANWQQDRSPFPQSEKQHSAEELKTMYLEAAAARTQVLEKLDSDSAQRIVYVEAGGPATCFRVIESMLHLCGHGTHHRAQCVNMLRQLGVTFSWIDMIVWVREQAGQ